MCNTIVGIHYTDDNNIGLIIGIVIGIIAAIVIGGCISYYFYKRNQSTRFLKCQLFDIVALNAGLRISDVGQDQDKTDIRLVAVCVLLYLTVLYTVEIVQLSLPLQWKD